MSQHALDLRMLQDLLPSRSCYKIHPGFNKLSHCSCVTIVPIETNQSHFWGESTRQRCHEQVLRPLRKVLAQMHPKLRRLGLMTASVQTLGYLLAAFDEGVDG
jgi:hypothetical protein